MVGTTFSEHDDDVRGFCDMSMTLWVRYVYTDLTNSSVYQRRFVPFVVGARTEIELNWEVSRKAIECECANAAFVD